MRQTNTQHRIKKINDEKAKDAMGKATKKQKRERKRPTKCEQKKWRKWKVSNENLANFIILFQTFIFDIIFTYFI